MTDVLALQRQARIYYNTITGDRDDTDGTFASATIPLTFKFDQSFGNKLSGMINNPLRPTLKELNSNQKELAELIKVGTVYDKKGPNEAIKRLNDNLPNYTLDAELSNSNYVVVRKPSGKIVVAFRGTNPSGKIKSGIGKGLAEPVEWLMIQSGHENIFDEHKLQPIKDSLLRKYRPDQIETITGYSMGGTKAYNLGDMMGIKTTLFNPYLGKSFFGTPLSPNTQHQIIRTTEDIATAQALFTQGVSKLPKNVSVDSIDPVITVKNTIKKLAKGQGPLSIYNIVQTHNLENFTQDGDRTSLQRNVNEVIDKRVQQFNNDTINVTPVERARLQTEMLTELEPNLRLMSQDLDIHLTPATKLFRSLKGSNIVSALAGLGGGVAIDRAINEIQTATGIRIDDHVTTAISGGLGAIPQETAIRFLGGKINLMRSIGSGIAGAVAQEVVADTTNELLINAGVSTDVAEITSQTVGGGVGGVVSAAGVQIASQIGTRVAVMAGFEAGAAAAGSVVPVFGTLIGLAVGALVSGVVAIVDVESRRNAPITANELDFANSLITYLAIGGTMDVALNGIDDDIQKDRIRRIVSDPDFQERIQRTRSEQRRTEERFLQEEGISDLRVSVLDSFISERIPNFNSLSNREKNIRFNQLANDPRNAEFINQYSVAPRWDESSSDSNARDFRTPMIIIKNLHLLPPAPVEAVEVPEVPVPQKIPLPPQPVHARGSHAINIINADPQVRELMAKNDFYSVNKRIREIFVDNSDQSSFGDTVNYGDAGLPQLTDTGNMVYKKYDDAPIIPLPQPTV